MCSSDNITTQASPVHHHEDRFSYKAYKQLVKGRVLQAYHDNVCDTAIVAVVVTPHLADGPSHSQILRLDTSVSRSHSETRFRWILSHNTTYLNHYTFTLIYLKI